MADSVDGLVLDIIISCVILGSHLTALCLGKVEAIREANKFCEDERDEKYLDYVWYTAFLNKC